MTFGIGVEPVWSVVGSVGLRFLWLDEDVGSFSLDDTMVQLYNTAKWHNGAMRWYNEMVRRYDGTIFHNGAMAQCTMAQLHIAICIINVLK